MNKTRLTLLLFLMALSVGCSKKKISTDLDYYNLLKDEPIQEELSEEKIVTLDDFKLTELYSYKISAKVLRKEDYSDKLADIVPLDLALGWNKMSDKDLLDKSKIKISQSNRFYFWRVPSFDILKRKEIENNSANVHIIPSNKTIKDYLEDEVDEGDNIYMEGFLVDVSHMNDPRLTRKTSTKRTDTGAGACEIFYVTKIKHLVNQ